MAVQYYRSNPIVLEATCSWKIPHFSWQRSEFSSLIFSADGSDNYHWKLTMEPRSTRHGGEEVVLVHLVDMCSKSTFAHRLVLSIPAADNTGGTPITVKCHWGSSWTENSRPKRFTTMLVSQSHLCRYQEYYLRNDTLIVFCKLTVMADTDVFQTIAANDIRVPPCRLASDFEHLLWSEMACDVAILTGPTRHHAHKTILSARSPVFAAMFRSDWGRNFKNTVVIKDLPNEVVHEMLLFIYTDRRPQTEKVTNGLLMAGERYKLDRLKAMCERVMASKITYSSAVDIYGIAKRCNAEQLMACACNFVKEHAAEVEPRCTNNNRKLLFAEIIGVAPYEE